MFDTLEQARTVAAQQAFREKAVCYVVRGSELLVFDHVPDDSGVQVPAGGVEADESPAEAAMRELWEESGLQLSDPTYLTSYEWIRPSPRRSQICHVYAFAAAPNTPDAWTHPADDHVFAFRWASVRHPGLDWEMDAALPALQQSLFQESP
ncbi:NUDIX domain-containing protein [Deinococcus sp. KNUC1210]|uniref:NUDIX domain-containing protein n=1 Tax=Deinococcus sp. KNUC1210 TaxID=2917691 RepID=UPI001EF1588C|nr:NUDIX domain-containing protein [Deinococcus sp. KNUC1210]ULH15191.1 NUDIX domain-containing protein [Deinococcus sp. KNUC1210]